MSSKFKQHGKSINFTAGANLSAGDPVLFGALIGIVEEDVESGDEGVATIEGVHEVTKVSAQAWAEGDRIYWDVSLAKFTNVKDTDTNYAGVATAVAANPSSTGELKLNVGVPLAALVAFSAGTNLTAVPGSFADEAAVQAYLATLLAEIETRLDASDTFNAALLAALKGADLMAIS